jgi:hypothetical protein
MSAETLLRDDHRTAQELASGAGQNQSDLLADPPRCGCGSAAVLRHCTSNNAVGWQCTRCFRMIGCWLPHASLIGIRVADLRAWVKQ